MDTLKTGDLILFGGEGIFSRLIETVTHSDYSHCGIILKDPYFIHPALKGLYLWESGWEKNIKDVENHKQKLGVQIVPLHQVLSAFRGSVYYRSLHAKVTEDSLSAIHDLVHGKPYDIYVEDWIEAYIQMDLEPQKTDRMFCSAFVSLVYTKCNILRQDTDWSIVRPSDLANDVVVYMDGCSLGAVSRLTF